MISSSDNTRRRKLLLSVLWILPFSFLLLFYFFPLSSILSVSFSRADNLLSPFIDVLTKPSFLRTIWFTVWQAFLSTLLTFMIGIPGAYVIARFKFPGKSWFRALSGVPFVLPTIVVATAFSSLLGPRGWMNLWLMDMLQLEHPPIQFMHTFGAILTAHVFYNTTIVLRMVGDFWANLDPRLHQAGRVLGANQFKTFRHITFPLLSPVLSASALMVFIFNFTSFGVILILGGPSFATLEVDIYYQTVSLFNLPVAGVLSLIQLLFTLILTLAYLKISKNLSRPLRLKPRRITAQIPVTLSQKVITWLVVISLGIFFLAPLASLAIRSFSRLEPDRGSRVVDKQILTIEHYRELSVNRRDSVFFTSPWKAIGVSLSYATLAVVIALLVGIPASIVLARRQKSFLNTILDPLVMLPLGTSAVTLGLGFIVALDSPPLDLRASPVLIPIAHALVAFPFVVRSLVPALRSIRPQLRSAGALLGASPSKVFRYIDLPLTARAVLVSAVFAFTISLGEFGATAVIARPEFTTIPVAIFRLLSQPGGSNYGQALAMSTILMVVTTIGILGIEKFRIADIGEF